MKLETLCLHGGTQPDPTTLSRGVPIYRTSSYVFKNAEHAANLFALRELGNIYTRLMNPTTDVLEKRVALLEGAPELGGLGVASGTSGVFYSIINVAQAGDNIVSARNLYGGSYTQFHDILPGLGITTKFVDSNDPQNFARAIDEKTRALFCETVSNPALEITDLEAVAQVAHDHGIPLVVDATFSTPYLTQPLKHGADIVVHSLDQVVRGARDGHRRGGRGQRQVSLGRGQASAVHHARHKLPRPALGHRPARCPATRLHSFCGCGPYRCATSVPASLRTTRGCSFRASKRCP